MSDFIGWVDDSPNERSTFLGIGLTFSSIAWVYWLFCIHRLHKILGRATQSTYRIGPWKAVLLLLVPFFNWYWRFRMCNQIATFVNTRSTLHMKKGWDGAFMLAGSLLGTLALFLNCTSLRWFVLFGVAHHLTRKIRHTVKFRQAMDLARQRQLDLAMTAGLGAAFAFVLCKGIVEFYDKTPRLDKLKDGIAILLVSLAVVRFIEPLNERLRVALGAEMHHSSIPESQIHKRRVWGLRGFLTATLVFSIFFHNILHEQFFNLTENWQPLLAALVISGGVTYFWIAGARQDPSRAAWLGVLSGGLLAIFISGSMGTTFDETHPPSLSNARTINEKVEALAYTASEIPVAKHHFPSIPYEHLSTAWPWALFGLIGGIIIDRHKSRHNTRSLVLGILLTAVVCEALLFAFIYQGKLMSRGLVTMANLSAIVGWCVGLLLHPATQTVFGQRGPAVFLESHSPGVTTMTEKSHS
jgi:hypothetical protein